MGCFYTEPVRSQWPMIHPVECPAIRFSSWAVLNQKLDPRKETGARYRVTRDNTMIYTACIVQMRRTHCMSYTGLQGQDVQYFPNQHSFVPSTRAPPFMGPCLNILQAIVHVHNTMLMHYMCSHTQAPRDKGTRHGESRVDPSSSAGVWYGFYVYLASMSTGVGAARITHLVRIQPQTLAQVYCSDATGVNSSIWPTRVQVHVNPASALWCQGT